MYLVRKGGEKKGGGLLYSLACSSSAPVLYKPDNKYGTRQGCPLWKELFFFFFSNKSHYAGSMLPGETAGVNATHRDGGVCQNM